MTTILLFALCGYGAGLLTKASRPVVLAIACFAALVGMAVAGAQGQLAPATSDCAPQKPQPHLVVIDR